VIVLPEPSGHVLPPPGASSQAYAQGKRGHEDPLASNVTGAPVFGVVGA
jgi:hypothetical protein